MNHILTPPCQLPIDLFFRSSACLCLLFSMLSQRQACCRLQWSTEGSSAGRIEHDGRQIKILARPFSATRR